MTAWARDTTAEHSFVEVGNGAFGTFSFVRDAFYQATTHVSTGAAIVGHLPIGFDPPELVRTIEHREPTIVDLPTEEFALASWQPARRRLVLFRDPLGARALYYVHEPGEWVAFASMPEPLLRVPGTTDHIDEGSLPALLLLGVQPLPSATLFERLRRVPAANRVAFEPAGAQCERFWMLSGPPRRRPDPDVPHQLRELLESSVRRRVQGVDHVGAQLSGGLDSAVTTALADQLRSPPTKLSVFNVRPHNEQGDLLDPGEAEAADALIAGLRDASVHVLPHHKTSKPFFLAEQRYLDRPLPDLVFLLGAQDRTIPIAAEVGCQTLLTGWGGDEMASFRATADYVLAMLRERRWALAADNLRHEGALPASVRRLILRPMRNQLRGKPSFDAAERELLLAPFRGRALEGAIAAELEAGVRQEPLRKRRRSRIVDPSFHVVMEVLDWLGQKHGLCIQHPLLDRSVLEFCDRMPIEWIAIRGETRRAFREAVDDVLPEPAKRRVKSLLTAGASSRQLRDRLEASIRGALQALARSDSWLHEYVDVARLERDFALLGPTDGSVVAVHASQIAASSLVVARAKP